MNKKVVSIIGVLLVLAVSVHYAMWNYIANTAEQKFSSVINSYTKYTSGDIRYKLVKSGYPFNIRFELINFGIYTEKSEISIESDTNRGLRVSVPFTFNSNELTIETSMLDYTLNILSPTQDITSNILVDKLNFVINELNGKNKLTGFIDGISLDTTIANKKTIVKIDIDKISFNKNTEINEDILNSYVDSNISMAKIKIKSPKKDIAFNLNSYTAKGGVKNFAFKSLDNIHNTLYRITKDIDLNKSQTINMSQLKIDLKAFVYGLAKNSSVIYLDELSYKFSEIPNLGDLSINISTNLSVASNYTPRGKINLKVKGLNKLSNLANAQDKSAKGIMQLPMASAFMGGKNINVTLKTDNDGVLIFNGAPMFPVPTLNTLIDLIPDSLKIN